MIIEFIELISRFPTADKDREKCFAIAKMEKKVGA